MNESKPPLWLWGLLLILAGGSAFMVFGPPQGGTSEQRGMALGMGLVQGLAILSGIALIVVHFARASRK